MQTSSFRTEKLFLDAQNAVPGKVLTCASSSGLGTWADASGGGGSPVTLASAGGDETLVYEGSGPNLAIKGLSAALGVSLSAGLDDITIGATGTNITLASAGGDESLVFTGSGPNLAIKGLSAGDGIDLISSPNSEVQIVNTRPETTIENAVASPLGEDLVVTASAPAYVVKQISAGDGISLSSASESVSINTFFDNSPTSLVNQVYPDYTDRILVKYNDLYYSSPVFLPRSWRNANIPLTISGQTNIISFNPATLLIKSVRVEKMIVQSSESSTNSRYFFTITLQKFEITISTDQTLITRYGFIMSDLLTIFGLTLTDDSGFPIIQNVAVSQPSQVSQSWATVPYLTSDSLGGLSLDGTHGPTPFDSPPTSTVTLDITVSFVGFKP